MVSLLLSDEIRMIYRDMNLYALHVKSISGAALLQRWRRRNTCVDTASLYIFYIHFRLIGNPSDSSFREPLRGDQAIFDFCVFHSFLAAISSFLGQSGQTKYLWNLWDKFYLAMKKFLKLHYDVIEKLDFQKKKKQKKLPSHIFFKYLNWD